MAGFIQGRSKATGEIIRYHGDGPIITIAPTGAGKTSGPAICNALTHPGQLICLDVKGKVYDATADRRRKMGQEVYKIDVREMFDSDAMNPMDFALRAGGGVSAIARGMAAEMVERTGKEREMYWVNSAETMLTGGLAYIWTHLPKEKHRLDTLFDLYTDGDIHYKLARLLETTSDINRSTYAAWATFLGLPEMTRGCVLSSTVDQIRLFDDPAINHCVRATSFDLEEFISGQPISIYIVVPPYRMTALRPLLRLMISGLLNLVFLRKEPPPERTLMLVDEAAQLGRLDLLLVATTLGREYGLTLHTIWQNVAQLEIYENQARTIIDNAGVFQCFGMRNLRMANEIAGLIGGFSGDALMAMDRDDVLISLDCQRPEIAAQVRYYREPMFEGMFPAR